MIETEDPNGYLKRNIELHKTIYLRAQAPTMLAVLETVLLQLGPTMKSVLNKNMQSLTIENHTNIISALHSGNFEKLIKFIRADITSDFEQLLP